MTALDRFLQRRPEWVYVVSQSADKASIAAHPPLARPPSPSGFLLELNLTSNGGVAVRENQPASVLPSFCPERHINPGGTFCIFYGSDAPLGDDVQADRWWDALCIFLVNQGYAERFGVWPLNSGLSHGEAALDQVAMEALAEPLGWTEEVLTSMFRATGWLSGQLPRISKDRKRVLNARSPCPRGCTRKHALLRKRSCDIKNCAPGCRKQHKPILRVDCPHRNTVEKLVLHEHSRRLIEVKFMSDLKRGDYVCCGTMKHCLLRNESAAD